MLAKSKEVDDFDLDTETTTRHHRAYSHAKRITKKFSHVTSPYIGPYHRHGSESVSSVPPTRSAEDDGRPRTGGHRAQASNLIDEVAAWVRLEKEKKKARKSRRKAKKKLENESDSRLPKRFQDISRSPSATSSSSSLDLDGLEAILEKGMKSSVDLSSSGHLPSYGTSSLNLRRLNSRPSRHFRRASTLKPHETEVQDDEILVPSCDVVLDNSKTLSYTGGARPSVDNSADPQPSKINARAWAQFKHEIVRLSHTLKLKGWRQVPMAQSEEILVERLSGALTNAVYVVAPPDIIHGSPEQTDTGKIQPRKPPVYVLQLTGRLFAHESC